jgi:integrase
VAIVAAGTGLRPEELFALEWRDIDRKASVVHVRRAYARGRLKEWGKTERSRRRVPLRQRVLDALGNVPRRLDLPLVFSAAKSAYVDLHNFRAREWIPAVRGAGFVDANQRATRRWAPGT